MEERDRAFVALVNGLESFLRALKARWKRGTARFHDTWVLLDGDVVAVALVIARVF